MGWTRRFLECLLPAEPEVPPRERRLWSSSRRSGFTEMILRRGLGLSDELLDSRPVLIRTHTMGYAQDLAHRFAKLAKTQYEDVSLVRRNIPEVVINGRAVFQFCSYDQSNRLQGSEYREVLDDNSITNEVVDRSPDYD